ncbi:MAG TPA: malonyl-ACP O-methyltransferase BioC [Steroidobacteraceae bacterium]|nr:malonyl-ACP O-methyltransferase BioC [Steroidobacteraceae bacterium]
MTIGNSSDHFQLDKAGVRAAFDRASATYEGAAVLQSRVADELVSRLEPFEFHPQVILDLGAGTGRATAELKRRYRRSLVIALDLAPGMLRQAARHRRLFRRFERVCADAARLPLESASVDIVFSNLMLQWCDPPDEVFAEVRRVLKPQGFFTFTTFGPDTLKELRFAWAEADTHNHVNRFFDMHDVGDALVRAGLQEPVLDVDRTELTYSDGMAVMRDLKSIGARNATAGRPRSLVGRDRLQRVLTAYESFRKDGRLPATYEIVYGAAWGSAGRPAASVNAGEVRISPADIRRRKKLLT